MDAVFATLGECLQVRAQQHPDKELYTFLDIDGEQADRLSYAELDRRARLVAGILQARGAGGRRVLLLFAPGLDFAVAYYACMYAGAVAVPAYPPDPARLERTLPRLQAIAADASPMAVLTSAAVLAVAEYLFSLAPDLAGPEWLAVDELVARGDAPDYRPVASSPDDLALIQYTSGSTSAPKGVMVSHRNLICNAQMCQQVAQVGEDRLMVSWVPTYHDMGLMFGIMLPVFVGSRSVLISPLDFLRRPAVWLGTIHRYRATDSCVPNFALDLSVRKIPEAERREWDLSCLRLCLIGAEPVRHASLERFVRSFEQHGLARHAMFPSYGLAEAVVAVSCSPRGGWRTAFVDAEALANQHFVEIAANDPKALPLVACGEACPEVSLEIIDPATRLPAGPGEIGEVWIEGPNVALGYWQHEADNREIFQARRADQPARRLLRTGDLGYLKQGQLYVAGRVKDLIIVRGRNYYPQDIELSAELSHPRIRPGAVIAFSIERDGAECPVVVAEVDPRQLRDDAEKTAAYAEVAVAIRTAVAELHALQVQAVTLISTRTIDKTSSGKLARRACRARYLEGRLETEFAWSLEEAVSAAEPFAAAELPTLAEAEFKTRLAAYLQQKLSHACGADILTASAPPTRIDTLGLDSLATAELVTTIEHDLQVKLSIPAFLGAVSFDDLLTLLAGTVARRRAPSTTSTSSPAVALQEPRVVAPIFCAGGVFGAVAYLTPLAEALGESQPFIAFQAPGLDGAEPPLRSVEELATRYLEAMQAIQPNGPYLLAGHSFGGLVAYEMARRLTERGEPIAHLLLIDSSAVDRDEPAAATPEAMALYELAALSRKLSGQAPDDVSLDTQQHTAFAQALLDRKNSTGSNLEPWVDTHVAHYAAMVHYRPLPYRGPVTLFRAKQGFPAALSHPDRRTRLYFGEASLGWSRLCSSLHVVEVPGDHFDAVLPPHAEALAAALRGAIGAPIHWRLGLHRLLPERPVAETGRAIAVSKHGVRFDPHHAELLDDPYPILAQLREHDPVHWYPGMSAWWVSRYADVSAGLRDPRFIVDSRHRSEPQRLQDIGLIENSAIWSPLGGGFRERQDTALSRFYNASMLFLDPPAHQRLRQHFAPMFDATAMKNLAAQIDGVAEELVAEMQLRRDPDIVRDLALPLPVRVISTMLGIPQEDAVLLTPWSHELFRGFDPVSSSDGIERIHQAAEHFMAYMAAHIRKRRQAGAGSDLLGHLLGQTDEQGRALSDEELIANSVLLFTAGFETVANVVASGTLALLRHSDQLELLRGRPELAAQAADELLRYEGALRIAFRTAREDLEFGGKQIRSGDPVAFVLAAANRDPQMFADPERLDITRHAKPHVAFAHGIHYCLGAPLARLEIQSAIKALSRRDFTLVANGYTWKRSLIFRSLSRLRIQFRC